MLGFQFRVIRNATRYSALITRAIKRLTLKGKTYLIFCSNFGTESAISEVRLNPSNASSSVFRMKGGVTLLVGWHTLLCRLIIVIVFSTIGTMPTV